MIRPLLFVFLIFSFFGNVVAQSPGIIVRPAGGNGVTPLNPNGDGFSSSSTNGFINSDITESEVPYKVVPTAFLEPTSDLLRGPSQLYSDLVRSVDGSGFYVYNDGTNLLFRLRLGNIISGSKGYSILMDTDGKIGNTGPYADPNYQAATTGINGNPGFELEVVLETNFRVAVYNVDGTSTPSLISSYGINTNSQISVALSTVSGTADYFYDFYVPISALSITSSTSLRMVATTVMAPMAAIGGPKSDIYGVNDASYNDPMKSWEAAINNTPTYNLTNINSGGSGAGSTCTAAPIINSPIQAGSGITVTGTWTALDGTKPSTATVTLYKNGVSAGTASVNSGSTWSISGITLAAGDVLYAKAQATGESMCLQSNSVQVVSCSNVTSTSSLSFACISRKGIRGTRPSNATVKLYTVSTSGYTLLADDNSTTYKINYPDAVTWSYDGQYGGGSDPCTTVQSDVDDGSYAVTAQETGKCASEPVFTCLNPTNQVPSTTTPTVTSTNIYTGTTSFSGTTSAGALVRLYVDGRLQATTTANGSGNYTFSSLVLAQGDVLDIIAQVSGGCVSAVTSKTVTCYTTPPVITTDNNGNLSTGSTTISGKSGEANGTVVTVYENGISIGTANVSSGAWSLTYTPVSGKSYTAKQQNGACAVSSASDAASALAATSICPSISGSYSASATSVTGTLSASFSGTVRLYLDGVNIASTTVSNATTWTISGLNSTYTNMLYSGGVLTVTSQATGASEKTNCSSSVTLSCPTIATPSISPTSSTIITGQSVNYTVSNSVSGLLYAVTSSTSSTTNYAVSKWGTGSSLSVPTTSFNTPGTYNVLVSAVSFSGAGCLSSSAATISVNAALPVTLLSFTGRYVNNHTQLEWETATEENVDYFAVERSDDGRQFTQIGTVRATGNSTLRQSYTFTDNTPVTSTAWYRLRIIDKTLQWEYSNMVRITNTAGNINVSSLMPNPFDNFIKMQVYSDKAAATLICIVDLTGRQIYSSRKVLSAGNNNLTIFPPATLAKGVYVLQLVNGKEVVWMQKIQKVR